MSQRKVQETKKRREEWNRWTEEWKEEWKKNMDLDKWINTQRKQVGKRQRQEM